MAHQSVLIAHKATFFLTILAYTALTTVKYAWIQSPVKDAIQVIY
jgi:hypothetical protein